MTAASPLNRHLHTRKDQSSLNRVSRFLESRGGIRRAAADLAEEAWVRAMLQKPLRRVAATLRGQQQPETWLFVVGCYNSGTTILGDMLSAHPEIASLPREGIRFAHHLSNLETESHHMHWGAGWESIAIPPNGRTAAEDARKDWAPFWRRGATVHLEKSVANTARIPWLAEHFPNARFIGIHRNGYCVAEGLRRRSRPPQWLKDKTGLDHYPLEMSAQQWLSANDAMLKGLEAVEHKVIVAFEDLVADPVLVMSKLFRFMDVEPVSLDVSGDQVMIGGTPFPFRNPNPASLKRLSDADLAVLKPFLGGMMQELGYKA